MRMMQNRRDNGEDGKTENTQGKPDSSYSLQELLIFPQPMVLEQAIVRTSKTAGQICSSAKQENAPKPTVSTFWELVMFHMCFRRHFRNELCTKNAGSPKMLKTNKGRECEAS